jgi:hypothetical protein
MEPLMQFVGPGLSLLGVVVLGLADAWLSRSILMYLDAVEANVATIVQSLRAGSTHVIITGVDLKRDRRQNRVRGLKMLGWIILAFGVGIQFVRLYLNRSAA